MSVRQGNKIIAGSAKAIGISIGTIFTAPYNNYIPEGAVLADGTEFDATQFPDLWKDYIQGGRLLTCTYQEFNADVAKSGGCAKFAVSGNKFKVPMVGNGTFIAGGNGESFSESLPNITGDFDGGANELGINKVSGAFAGQNTTGQKGTSGSAINRSKYTGVTFDASRVSSAYQDGAKVQPANIRMRYYIQVASGSVNQSMMDWSRYMQGLEGKANTDADNFTSVGKDNITNFIAPDFSKVVEMSFENQMTMPFTGWMEIVIDVNANGFLAIDGNFFQGTGVNAWVGGKVFLEKGRRFATDSGGLRGVVTCKAIKCKGAI